MSTSQPLAITFVESDSNQNVVKSILLKLADAHPASDQQDAILHLAISNSSAFIVHDSTWSDLLNTGCSIRVGIGNDGTHYFATCINYAILHSVCTKQAEPLCFAGITSYTPAVLSKQNDLVLFMEPGNAWPMNTMGLSDSHSFNSIDSALFNVSFEDPHLSTSSAINHVLCLVAGKCDTDSTAERFLIGFHMLWRLRNTLKHTCITIENADHHQYPAFDVHFSWTKLIAILLFGQNANGLSNDIERLVGFEHNFLEDRFDDADTWNQDASRSVLLFAVAFQSNCKTSTRNISFYADNMINTAVFDKKLIDTIVSSSLNCFISNLLPSLMEQHMNGELEPSLLRSPIRHNAGEYLTDTIVPSSGVVSGIRYVKGLQPIILPSASFKFNVRQPGLRAILKIVGEDLVLESRNLTTLAKEYQNQVTGFSILGNGITRSYVRRVDVLKGSMVANIAFAGILGPAAALWLLSHFIYGDLTVSERSLACYADGLAVPDGKLVLSAPIAPEVMRSIHTVTDGEKMYSVWHPKLVFELEEKKGVWHASKLSNGIGMEEEVQSCFITSNRYTCG